MQVIINQATPTLIVFISPDNDIIVVPIKCAENVHDLELVVTSTSVSSSLLCAHTHTEAIQVTSYDWLHSSWRCGRGSPLHCCITSHAYLPVLFRFMQSLLWPDLRYILNYQLLHKENQTPVEVVAIIPVPCPLRGSVRTKSNCIT